MDWLYEYLIFLLKALTVVFSFALFFGIVFYSKRRSRKSEGELIIKDVSERYKEIKEKIKLETLDEKELKRYKKELKKEERASKFKKRGKVTLTDKPKNTTYILSFTGSVNAYEVDALREEITAVLSVATEQDEVLLKLESPGGVVHGYGLCASQLMRIRHHNIPLTIAVDKVAASGGYMMACTGTQIVAAPFAIVGSIGVVAQIPNFHRLLKKHDIDVELQTAGKYKRTLTMLGENTEEGREKFQEELEETHVLFKEFIKQNRPILNVDEVSTGEHWFGTQALEKGLIDQISTSDDLIMDRLESRKLVAVSYQKRRSRADKAMKKAQLFVEQLFFRNGRTL